MKENIELNINPYKGEWSIDEINFRISCLWDDESSHQELHHLIELKYEIERYERTKKEIEEYFDEIRQYDDYDENEEIKLYYELYDEYDKAGEIVFNDKKLLALANEYHEKFPMDTIDELADKIRNDINYKSITTKRKIISCIRYVKNTRNVKELISYEFLLNIKVLELFMKLCDEKEDDTLLDIINELQTEVSESLKELENNEDNYNVAFLESEPGYNYLCKLGDVKNILNDLICFESYKDRNESDIVALYILCDTLNDKEINSKYKNRNKNFKRLYKSLKRQSNKKDVVEEIIRLKNESLYKRITNREIARRLGKSESYISKLRKEYNL